ncbi:MAG TPA: hypothetical protein DCQ30_04795 [Acidimicrobiaceae bacterium]|nr:hypothetical protein [Acidimicrobiaceae bacterium]
MGRARLGAADVGFWDAAERRVRRFEGGEVLGARDDVLSRSRRGVLRQRGGGRRRHRLGARRRGDRGGGRRRRRGAGVVARRRRGAAGGQRHRQRDENPSSCLAGDGRRHGRPARRQGAT